MPLSFLLLLLGRLQDCAVPPRPGQWQTNCTVLSNRRQSSWPPWVSSSPSHPAPPRAPSLHAAHPQGGRRWGEHADCLALFLGTSYWHLLIYILKLKQSSWVFGFCTLGVAPIPVRKTQIIAALGNCPPKIARPHSILDCRFFLASLSLCDSCFTQRCK